MISPYGLAPKSWTRSKNDVQVGEQARTPPTHAQLAEPLQLSG